MALTSPQGPARRLLNLRDVETGLDGDGSCPSCGASGVGGLDGCLTVFGTLGAREFSDPAYFAAHRVSVDAYCLQHPELYMKSSKSAAAHLAAMCWTMEYGRSRHMPSALKQWVDGRRTYTRIAPPPPARRGELTVLSIVDAASPADYEARVLAWATSAWQAWAVHWAQARQWVEEALAEQDHHRRRRGVR